MSEIFHADWSQLPFDIVTSVILYLSPREIVNLCIQNDFLNQKIYRNKESSVWKLLYQRDISEKVPPTNIAGEYFRIMNEVALVDLDRRLFHAVTCGYNSMVNRALDAGADIHLWLDHVIVLAAGNGHCDTMKLLFDRGIDYGTDKNKAFFVATYYAVQNGQTDAVRLLLDKGVDVLYDDSALFRVAVRYGYCDLTKLLLDRGANVHANRDRCFLRAINRILTHKDYAMAELLLDKGATAGPKALKLINESDDVKYWFQNHTRKV